MNACTIMERRGIVVKENLFRIILAAPQKINGFTAANKYIHCTLALDFFAPHGTLIVSEIGLKKNAEGDIVNCTMNDKESMYGTLVRIMGSTQRLSSLMPLIPHLFYSWEDPVITDDRYALVGISEVSGDVLFDIIKNYV